MVRTRKSSYSRMTTMYRLLTIAAVAALALTAQVAEGASRPSEVIESAVVLLNEGLDGRKDELAADDVSGVCRNVEADDV